MQPAKQNAQAHTNVRGCALGLGFRDFGGMKYETLRVVVVVVAAGGGVGVGVGVGVVVGVVVVVALSPRPQLAVPRNRPPWGTTNFSLWREQLGRYVGVYSTIVRRGNPEENFWYLDLNDLSRFPSLVKANLWGYSGPVLMYGVPKPYSILHWQCGSVAH